MSAQGVRRGAERSGPAPASRRRGATRGGHALWAGLLLWGALQGCEPPASSTAPLAAPPELATSAWSLTRDQRIARYAQIRDAAAARGLTRTGYLLAGIAHAETGLAHCWSEATWACQGPASVDCGGGPVIAGAGDGPCALREGGLGMFQFDGGTFEQTLQRDGVGILTVAGNVSRAIDFVTNMVRISAYTRNAETDERALRWMADFNPHDAGLRDAWVRTVTHYYNGCRPEWGCFQQRYGHYASSLQTVIDETGFDFWVVDVAPPDAPPVGFLDAVDCDGVRGWAQDPDRADDAIDVHVYFGGPAGSGAVALSVAAAEHREDLCAVLGSCAHGFTVRAPASLFDDVARPVHAYGIGAEGGANAELGDSPRALRCPPVVPPGVRRHVVDPQSYEAWRLDAFFDRLPVDEQVAGSIPTREPLPAAPRLVRSDDGSPEVWLIDGPHRRHIQSPAVMAAWRFDWASIETWPAADVQAHPVGAPWRPVPVQVVGEGAVWIIDDALPAPEPPEPPEPPGDGGSEPGPPADAGAGSAGADGGAPPWAGRAEDAGATAAGGDALVDGAPGEASPDAWSAGPPRGRSEPPDGGAPSGQDEAAGPAGCDVTGGGGGGGTLTFLLLALAFGRPRRAPLEPTSRRAASRAGPPAPSGAPRRPAARAAGGDARRADPASGDSADPR